MNSRISVATLAALVLLAAPATAAHASSAQVDTAGGSTRLVVHGGSGVDFIHVSAADGVVTVEDDAGISPGPGCARPTADTTLVTCVSELDGLPFGAIQFAGHAGNDGLYVDTALPNGAGAHLQGGDGHDIIKGSPAQDVIQPGAGQDHITAMGGDDVVLAGMAADENDTFDLGDGAADLVDYGDRSSAVSFSMSGTTAGTGWSGTGSEADVLEGVEHFRGTNLGDQFMGGPGDETVWAGGGDDDLFGQGGDDVLEAGAGADYVDGGSDDDTLVGDTGADTLMGGDHDDSVDAADGAADAVACDGEETEAPGTGDMAELDSLDPDDAACEVVAPRFSGTPAIAGAVRVGSTLTVAGAQTTARPAATVQVTWWSCATDEWDGCIERATSATYVPAAADLGRFLYAEVYAQNGGDAWTETDFTAAVAPALVTSGGGDDSTTGPQPQGYSPSGGTTPLQRQVVQPPAPPVATPPGAEALSQQLLSSAVAGLRGRVLRRLTRGHALPFTAGVPGTGVVELLAVSRPGAKAAAKATVLARGQRAYAAAGAGAITVRLTKAGAKLRRAKTAKVVVRVRFAPVGGSSVTRSRAVRLKR